MNIADDEKATKTLAALIPNWEIWFENILVNHMFFTQFPFDNPPMAFSDKYAASCCIYAMMRYLCLCGSVRCVEEIVDRIAAFFRLVDHTDFDRYAAQVLRKISSHQSIEAEQLLYI